MNVIRPTKSAQTGDPTTHGYNAYDFSGKSYLTLTAKYNGKVISSKTTETRNWLAFSANDPYKDTRNGKLLTADYGNHILVEYEGGLRHLIAHLEPATSVTGTFSKGAVLGVVGNTGNSTARHSHHEYRSGGKNIVVDFVDDDIISPIENMSQYTEQVFNQSKDVLPDQSYNFNDQLDKSKFKDELAVVKFNSLDEERRFRSDRIKEIDSLKNENSDLKHKINFLTFNPSIVSYPAPSITPPTPDKPVLPTNYSPTIDESLVKWIKKLWYKIWN